MPFLERGLNTGAVIATAFALYAGGTAVGTKSAGDYVQQNGHRAEATQLYDIADSRKDTAIIELGATLAMAGLSLGVSQIRTQRQLPGFSELI